MQSLYTPGFNIVPAAKRAKPPMSSASATSLFLKRNIVRIKQYRDFNQQIFFISSVYYALTRACWRILSHLLKNN
jgi:hypothetical protein